MSVLRTTVVTCFAWLLSAVACSNPGGTDRAATPDAALDASPAVDAGPARDVVGDPPPIIYFSHCFHRVDK